MTEVLEAPFGPRAHHRSRQIGRRVSGATIARHRLFARLDAEIAGSGLALLSAASGSGKTTLITSWLENRHAAGTADRRIIVVDDYDDLGGSAFDDRLAALLSGPGSPAAVVISSAGSRPLDFRRLGIAGETVPIDDDDLAMDVDEIAEILLGHRVEPTAAVVDAVARHTTGWAHGVRLAALHLRQASSVTAALRTVDRAIDAYVDRAAIESLPAEPVRVLSSTSMVEEVAPALVDAVCGPDARLHVPALAETQGFVQLGADGSFRTHPLLRDLLRRRLWQEPVSATAAARRAAEWTADNGNVDAAIDIAIGAEDWTWASRRLIESLAVPRLLTCGIDRVLERDEVADALAAAEPMLLAAAALGRSCPEIAELALDHAGQGEGRDGDGTDTSVERRISPALLRMALARWQGDATAGLRQLGEVTALLPQLSLSRRAAAPELIPLIQAHLGTFELLNGAPARARAAFERGARMFRARNATEADGLVQHAAADCLGQLAWLEAIAGELGRAEKHAADVLTVRPADSREVGVIHAQLATVCAHVARAEIEQASLRFENLLARHAESSDRDPDPATVAAMRLTADRLAAVVGDPRLRLRASGTIAPSGWFADQLCLDRVESELTAGQPSRALQILRDSDLPGAEAFVLRARGLIAVGDLSSVGAALRRRPIEELPLVRQVQLELIEAWLAQSHGDRQHQRTLIDRALRTAGREELRTPIAWAKSWLQSSITTDPGLLQRHGAFLASIRIPHLDDRRGEPTGARPTPLQPITTLTQRELDILQRLGSLCTNEEIAAELFLSTNTVKTHLKSLYRKLDVARRSEAFRRGRALGLC